MLAQHKVRVNGLHCHMSRARGLDAWRLRAQTMLGLVEKYDLRDLDYISLGSGMYGRMDPELMAQFPAAPNYREYGEAVISCFAEYYKDKAHKPALFTEPGTTLVSKYVDFVAKVIGIKTVRDRQFVLMNCSFHNLGETCQMKNLPIRIFHNGEQSENVAHANSVGCTCLEQDVIYHDYRGEIAVGDYVELGNVGG